MKQFSQRIVGELPYSQRITLHQIWAKLDKQYPTTIEVKKVK